MNVNPATPQIAGMRAILREGLPVPLGATWDGLGVNFALFSAHATKVELWNPSASERARCGQALLPSLDVVTRRSSIASQRMDVEFA